jgi:hypothetical protein
MSRTMEIMNSKGRPASPLGGSSMFRAPVSQRRFSSVLSHKNFPLSVASIIQPLAK